MTAIAEGLDSMVESGKKAYNKVQEIIDDRRVRQASLALSSINILISSDPVLASCKYAIKVQRKMFPIKKENIILITKSHIMSLVHTITARHIGLKMTLG